MADYNTITTYTGNGTTTDYAIPFEYSATSEVIVTVNGLTPSFTFVTDSLIRISPAPVSGASVLIRRSTDISEPAVTFVNGSPITAAQLNAGFRQSLRSAQEAFDQNSGAVDLALEQAGIAASAADDAAASALAAADSAADAAASAAALVDLDATDIPFQGIVPGSVTRTVQAKLRETISVADLVPVGATDHTSYIQAAIDYCVANYPSATLDLTGNWSASTLVISGGNGLHVTGNTVISANSSSAQNALLEIKMPGVIVEGAVKLNVGRRTNYARGLHVYATGSGNDAVQFNRLANITINGAKVGCTIGSTDYPNGLASELHFDGLSTYSCPQAAEVIGSETYVTLTNPQLSADDFGGDAAWQALTKRALLVVGADVSVIGGELLMTAATGHVLIENRPITGSAGTFYGSVRVAGTTCETASPLAITANPAALTINSTYNRRGLLSFVNCRGYHSQNASPFISTDSTFEGYVILQGNRFWYGPGTRTQNNVSCGSTLTHVYMDDMGLGDGFKSPWNGVSGGTIHHGRRTILRYQDPQSQSLAVGANTIKFKIANGVDTARWETGYNTSTGVWTATDTYANLAVRAQVAFASAASGTIIIIDNGTGVRTIPFTSQTEVAIDWTTANFAAGRTLKIDVNLSGSSNTVNSAGYLSTFTIEGRN